MTPLNPELEYTTVPTPFGRALLGNSPEGLVLCRLLPERMPEADEKLLTDNPSPSLAKAKTQLSEYLLKKRRDFDIELAPQGTPFQQKVWTALIGIPFGKTVSYMELSKQLGDPKAIRAVAAANGQNPLWVFVPCHRVIGSNGELTGYAWGLECKAWLLNLESKTPQLSLTLD